VSDSWCSRRTNHQRRSNSIRARVKAALKHTSDSVQSPPSITVPGRPTSQMTVALNIHKIPAPMRPDQREGCLIGGSSRFRSASLALTLALTSRSIWRARRSSSRLITVKQPDQTAALRALDRFRRFSCLRPAAFGSRPSALQVQAPSPLQPAT
jgi:hypothetical protein